MATKQTRLTPFGRKVRKRLIDKNMTQVELAALLGCNKQYIHKILVGGSTVLSSSLYDTGCDNIQFPLFRLAPNLKVAGLGHNGSRWWYWLSAVVSAAAFALCDTNGGSHYTGAAGDGGVRPYFCIG